MIRPIISFLLLHCAIDLDLILTEGLSRVVYGDIKEDEEGDIPVKTSLEIVNLLTNMYSVRKEAMESALSYLFTKSKDNDFQEEGCLKRKSTFEIEDGPSQGDKHKRLESMIVNKGLSKADSLVISEATIDDYDLGEFSISDTGVINFNGDLMFN